ncbi:MAG: hypothetical protein QOF54_1154 [Solirubrobacteraceae bacterium]|jgi:hypothetical protein|nr:hypothetical protein [Solirubrobacteraceae bacterium]
MGLLDDAIREHLELKRRSGADPGEVAREQHEALDPVERSAATAAGDDLLHSEPPAEANEPSELPDSRAIAGGVVEDVPDERATGAHPPDGGGGDETAELDMRTVLGDGATPGVAGGLRPAGGEQASAAGDRGDADEEDSLEWEMPGAEAPAQSDHDAPDEDVLEETPDFLRDTPEQERLWFEQRPPRDFDFDK